MTIYGKSGTDTLISISRLLILTGKNSEVIVYRLRRILFDARVGSSNLAKRLTGYDVSFTATEVKSTHNSPHRRTYEKSNCFPHIGL